VQRHVPHTIHQEEIMAKDPVCGMDVDPATARHKSEYHGQTYYFCAPGCRKAFEADPKKYLDPGYKPSM
jgi:P-type Cu+ transporter